MGKKIKIHAITTKTGGFQLGDNGAGDDGVVERIVYESKGYNKGKQGDFPAYVVFYSESNIRRITPQDQIVVMTVEVMEEEEAGEIAPELPAE